MTDKEQEEKQQNGQEEKGFSEGVVQSARELTQRAASRFAFHLKALGIGAATAALCAVFPSDAINVISGSPVLSKMAIGIATYFSLLLLFPEKQNKNATALGVFAGLGSLFMGLWALGPICAGLAAFAMNAANRWKLQGGSIFALVLVLLSLSIGGINVLKLFPLWYMLLFAGIVSFGILRPKVVPGFIDRFLASRKQKEQTRMEQEKLKIEQSKPVDLLEQAINSKAHESILAQINAAREKLSPEMCASVDTIAAKTQAIMQCMREDQRDISPGNKFLERYLPMIEQSMQNFLRLASHQAASPEFSKVEEQTTEALATMAHAFNEMHQHLLNDDVDDLLIDLKVMNQLIKIEGHKVPVER